LRVVKKIRVLIVDDSIVFREILARGIAEDFGIETYRLSPEYLMAVCAPLPFSQSDIRSVTWKEIKKSLPIYI